MTTLTARDKNRELQNRAERGGIRLSLDDANTLRRAELTLPSWAEAEANGTIQRPWDGTVDGDSRPYRATWHEGIFSRIPDRQAGALRRIEALVERLGIYWHHQQDCRGCMVYISNEPLTDSAYNRGLSVCN